MPCGTAAVAHPLHLCEVPDRLSQLLADTTELFMLQGKHGRQRAHAARNIPERPAAGTSAASAKESYHTGATASGASSSSGGYQKAQGRQRQEEATGTESAHAEGRTGTFFTRHADRVYALNAGRTDLISMICLSVLLAKAAFIKLANERELALGCSELVAAPSHLAKAALFALAASP